MKLLIRLPKYAGKRVVVKPATWYVDPSVDFHTEYGPIPTSVLKKNGKHTIKNKTYCVFDATPGDDYRQLKRDVQLITTKDLGMIGAYVGLHKNMVFAEAGTGSGGATCYFAPLVKKLHSFDIRPEPAKKVQKDLDRLSIKNVSFTTLDLTKEKTRLKEVDVFLLDLPHPELAWPAMECVVAGGWVVAYTPHATQMLDAVNAAPENFLHVHSCELIERHWKASGKQLRPQSADFSHTAFLTFFRKLY